jgi:hypothetical protein
VSSIWFLLIIAYSPAASRVLSAAPHDVAEWTVEPSPPGIEDPTDRANQPAAAALPPPPPLGSEKLWRPAVEGAVVSRQSSVLGSSNKLCEDVRVLGVAAEFTRTATAYGCPFVRPGTVS